MYINKVYKYIFSAIIILQAVSCAEETQQSQQVRKVPLLLDAVSQSVQTRAISSSEIQNTLFQNGQLISAYMPVTGATDVPATTTLGNPILLKSGSAVNGANPLTPNDESTIYFPPGNDVSVNIDAVYPYTVNKSETPETFSVVNPQISDEDYMQSDLMFASITTPKTDQTVHLQFAHQMAKLVVNAEGIDGLTIKEIKIKSIWQTVELDQSQSPWQLTTTLTNKDDLVIGSSSSYVSSLIGVALFPPQTKSDTYFMEVLCKASDNTEGIAYFLIAEKEFEKGRIYTINLKIGPKNLQAEGVGTVTIAPWPASVGTINVQAVGNLGLKIESLADDGSETTNTLEGSDDNIYYTYNGKICTPVPTVSDGKETGATTLVKGTHYDVAYYNNLNAGTAIIVITGKGDYEGLSTFKTYNIKKAINTMSYPSSTKSTTLSRGAKVDHKLTLPKFQDDEVYGNMTYKIYSDEAMTTELTGAYPLATVDVNGNVYMGLKRGGPVYVKATMDDTGNFEAKSVSYALTITAGDAATAMTVVWKNGDSFSYTGNAITPAFDVLDNGSTLAAGSNNDYTYEFSNNTNVGTQATLTITGRNEYQGTKTVYFTITKASNEFTTINTPSVPIDCGAAALTIPHATTGSRGPSTISLPAGTFSIGATSKFGTPTYTSNNTSIATVNSSTGVVTGVAAGTTTITVSVAGTTNYDALSQNINVTVEKMSYVFTYNGTTEGSGPCYQVVNNNGPHIFTKTFTANATLTAALVGAGGGNDGTGRGGLGGLVVAQKTFAKNASVTWYIFCGGGGESNTTGTTSGNASLGGWPGGGRPGTTGSSGAGGGATAICTTNSTANWTFNTSTDSRILVAGAGGGSSNGGNGGESAGVQAATNGDNPGSMISRTNTKAQWKGGDANVSGEGSGGEYTADGGGGGAGFYGGLGGLEVNSGNVKATGGHGGSNYIKANDGWTSLYSGTSAAATYGGVTFQENGHASGETDTGAVHAAYPGYVYIKITYSAQ